MCELSEQRLLEGGEAAKYLGISYNKLLQMIGWPTYGAWKVPAFRVVYVSFLDWRLDRRDLDEYIEKHKQLVQRR